MIAAGAALPMASSPITRLQVIPNPTSFIRLEPAVLRIFPNFPLVSDMPGYENPGAAAHIGGRPVLGTKPLFHVKGKKGETVYLRTLTYDTFYKNGWFREYKGEDQQDETGMHAGKRARIDTQELQKLQELKGPKGLPSGASLVLSARTNSDLSTGGLSNDLSSDFSSVLANRITNDLSSGCVKSLSGEAQHAASWTASGAPIVRQIQNAGQLGNGETAGIEIRIAADFYSSIPHTLGTAGVPSAAFSTAGRDVPSCENVEAGHK